MLLLIILLSSAAAQNFDFGTGETALNEKFLFANFSISALEREDLEIGLECRKDLRFWAASLAKFFWATAKLATCGNSTKCKQYYGKELADNQFAIKQIDAFGKLRAGVLEGNVWFAGSFQECIKIDVLRENHTNYQGKYCNAVMKAENLIKLNFFSSSGGLLDALQAWNLSTTPRIFQNNASDRCEGPWSSFVGATYAKIALCLPATCSKEEIYQIVTSLSSTSKGASPFCDVRCNKGSPPLDTKAIAMISVLSIFGTIALLATIYDYFIYQTRLEELPTKVDIEDLPEFNERGLTKDDFYQQQNWFVKVVLGFSLWSNGERILNVKQLPGQIHCIHSIRFISMSWVIMGHVYSGPIFLTDNVVSVLEYLPKNAGNIIIDNATFSVDTFFLLSGLLLGYLWFKEVIKTDGLAIESPKTWILFYLHRFIRLTPVYMLILGVYISLTPYFTSGPLQVPDGMPDKEFCAKHWWTNLLYINNLVSPNEQCFGVSWYLANDMQFHVFSPILLLSLWFFPAAGLAVAVVLVGIAMGSTAYTTGAYHLPAILLLGPPPDPQTPPDAPYFKDIYVSPWTRWNPYIVGVLVGYLLQTKPHLKIPKVWNLCGWAVAAATALAVLVGPVRYMEGHQMALWLRCIYAALCRFSWSCSIAWVIFSCHLGSGGPINRFLSWRIWAPLSRLTYCAYLLHVILEFALLTNDGRLPHWTNHFSFLMSHWIPLLVLTYVVSFFVSSVLELPFMNLEKIVLEEVSNLKRLKSSENLLDDEAENPNLTS